MYELLIFVLTCFVKTCSLNNNTITIPRNDAPEQIISRLTCHYSVNQTLFSDIDLLLITGV